MDSAREQRMEGGWQRMKGRLKEAWGSLTDDDLDKLEGKREQLEGLIAQRTGETRENIRRELARLSSGTEYRYWRAEILASTAPRSGLQAGAFSLRARSCWMLRGRPLHVHYSKRGAGLPGMGRPKCR